MLKKKSKYGLILVLVIFYNHLSYSQSFKGGDGDGYFGSTSELIDITAIPEFLTVTINQALAQTDPTNALPVTFDVVFNQDVVDFTFDDITWTGTAENILGTINGSGTNYTIEVTGIGGDGTLIPVIESGKVHDALGSSNAASTSTDNSVAYDSQRPGIEIVLEAVQTDPTNTSPVSFIANFTEEVTGFTISDITLSGSAGANNLLITGGPSSYRIDVSGMSGSGTVVIEIAEGLVADLAGNTNTTSINTQNTVYYDITQPEVTINQASSQSDPTNSLSVVFDVVFSKDVVDFTFDDITWNGTAENISGIIIGNGANYTVEVTGIGADGTLIPEIESGKVHDAFGSSNVVSTSTDNSVTYDSQRPGIEIVLESGQTDPTNNPIISFKAIFTEEVLAFLPSNVSVSGTAGADIVEITGGPLFYVINVSGMTNDGTVAVSIDEGVMSDAAGNTNTLSINTQNTVFYDNTKPDVVISSTESSPTNLSQIPVMIEFSSEVVGFELADINFANCTITAFNETVTGQRWEAVVEPVSEGTIILQIPAGIATDIAGNGNNASNNFSIDYERGNSAPLIDNQCFSVEEGSAFGTLVGTIVATDLENDGLSFSIVSGNLNNAFALDMQTGDITVANQEAIYYYTNPVFSLVVMVEDDYSRNSLSAQAGIEIRVNEAVNFEASNVFTPNSQQNRFWTIKNVERYADFELTIRNNAGKIVYQTKNYQNNWNGTYNNKPLPTGTYYYYLQNETKLFKGFINIIQE